MIVGWSSNGNKYKRCHSSRVLQISCPAEYLKEMQNEL